MVKVYVDGELTEIHEVEGGDDIEALWIGLLLHDDFFALSEGVAL
jgi:hypothetical protein